MPIAELKKTTDAKMNKTIEAFKTDLAKVRTGRAHPGLLDHVMVDYYGAQTPINQVAKITLIDARTIGVVPFDKKMIQPVDKAIRSSDLGLNPQSDGKVVRIPIPSLTDERRKELSRHVHKQAEEGRNVVRQVRRDCNERLKKLLKEHKISEDDERKGLETIQKTTDEHVKSIDELQKKKDAELLG